MGGKLVTVTTGPCAGLSSSEIPMQIESGTEGVHRVDVQHFSDGTTDVLCSYFRDGLCNALFDRKKDGSYKVNPSGKTGSCPFKK